MLQLDSIAVSLFVDDILIELTNTSIRRKDQNNHSDTKTRCLVQLQHGRTSNTGTVLYISMHV